MSDQNELYEAEVETARLEAENARLTTKSEALRIERDQKDREYRETRSNLAGWRRRAETAESEVTRLTAALGLMQKRAEGAERERDDYKESTVECARAVNDNAAQVYSLTRELADCEATLSGYKRRGGGVSNYNTKTVIDDAYIRVEIVDRYTYESREMTLEETRDEANLLMRQIKRHCDQEGARFEVDARQECSFCAHHVSPDENGTPQCCDEQIAFYQQARTAG